MNGELKLQVIIRMSGLTFMVCFVLNFVPNVSQMLLNDTGFENSQRNEPDALFYLLRVFCLKVL